VVAAMRSPMRSGNASSSGVLPPQQRISASLVRQYPPQSLAACVSIAARRILFCMGSKSRETIYGASIRAAAERATEARTEADRLAVAAWNKRMPGFQGPAQPSPALPPPPRTGGPPVTNHPQHLVSAQARLPTDGRAGETADQPAF
jgi:hypothetical protein